MTGHQPRDVARPLGIGSALLAIGVALGYLLTTIGARHTGELDASVWLTHHRPPIVADFARVIDVAIGQITAICAFAVLLIILLLGGRGWSVFTEIAIFAVAMLSVQVVKLAFERTRPPDPPVDRMVRLWDPHSMPSGHTAIATAIVSALCVSMWFSRRARMRWGIAVGVPFVVAVALSRVIVGAHYLGDVTVGILVSVGSTLLVVAALTHFDKLGPAAKGAKPLTPPSRRHPVGAA